MKQNEMEEKRKEGRNGKRDKTVREEECENGRNNGILERTREEKQR